MCLSKLESYFDLDQDVFFFKSQIRLDDNIWEFSVNLYEVVDLKHCCDQCVSDKIKRNFTYCNHFVFRLNSQCKDN